MSPRTETLTIRLSKETKDALRRFAKADKRPLAQLAAIIVEEWCEAREAKK
jgi:predicted transcriptional regulator